MCALLLAGGCGGDGLQTEDLEGIAEGLSGATARCGDGSYAYSKSCTEACAAHGGVAETLDSCH